MGAHIPKTAPVLQAPGAGISFPHRLILRLWFGPIISRLTSPDKVRSDYELVTQKIIAVASTLSKEERKVRIVVTPIFGLEDSSRYWSMNGVLEHILIVSRAIESTILALSAGVVPPGEAKTAAVKPTDFESDRLPEFISFAPGLAQRIDERILTQGLNFASSLTFHHPWFGPFMARQWYWLLAAHQTIHYRQAKKMIGAFA